jgi:hypothetical protein
MKTLARAWMMSLLILAAGPVEALGNEPPGGLVALIERLTRPPSAVPLPPIPGDPVGRLVAAANAHSLSLGLAVDHGPAIRRAGIAPEYAGRVALLMQAVLACGRAGSTAQRMDCAGAAHDAAAGILRRESEAPAFGDVEAWPSLYVDADGGNDVYRHDYAVVIDRGGNDVYLNNAGGNLLDHRRGPAGSVALEKAAAIGCEQVQGNFPAPTATAHDCIASPQAVLIDARGDDTYGAFRSPRLVDHNPPPLSGPRLVDGDCTADQLVRRIVLQGSGFEGNGLLMDARGNDRYRGKTLAQGVGHAGGIGVLRDLGGGDDDYLAIRNSQGFSLIGVLGLLQDDGGNDRYHTYMPRPRNPQAAFQTPGSGGVVDDTGVCDNLPRMVQGAALLGGLGHLRDDDGRDVYVGAPDATQPFAPGVLFAHSSQGFGCDGGTGNLLDRGRDDDTYRNGPPGRRDGAAITRAETACFAAPGLSVFQDDGG